MNKMKFAKCCESHIFNDYSYEMLMMKYTTTMLHYVHVVTKDKQRTAADTKKFSTPKVIR